MSQTVPNIAVISGDSGSEKITIDEWKQKPDGLKIQLITRRQVRFLSNNDEIPISEALAAIEEDTR